VSTLIAYREVNPAPLPTLDVFWNARPLPIRALSASEG
jgi:hypothetical protein